MDDIYGLVRRLLKAGEVDRRDLSKRLLEVKPYEDFDDLHLVVIKRDPRLFRSFKSEIAMVRADDTYVFDPEAELFEWRSREPQYIRLWRLGLLVQPAVDEAVESSAREVDRLALLPPQAARREVQKLAASLRTGVRERAVADLCPHAAIVPGWTELERELDRYVDGWEREFVRRMKGRVKRRRR